MMIILRFLSFLAPNSPIWSVRIVPLTMTFHPLTNAAESATNLLRLRQGNRLLESVRRIDTTIRSGTTNAIGLVLL